MEPREPGKEEVHIGQGPRIRIGQLAIGTEWLVAVTAIVVVAVVATVVSVLVLSRSAGGQAAPPIPASMPMATATPVPTSTPTPTPTATSTPTPVPFKTTSFKVDSRSSYLVPLDLSAGSLVEYHFTSDLDINFVVTDPQSNIVTSSSRSMKNEGGFTASTLGRYTLVFDNTFSVFTPKYVTLTYRIVPPGAR